MIIAIDFDGTCVKHRFPNVGEEIGARDWLIKWVAHGAQLVLYTMRDRRYLEQAIVWFELHGIQLAGANCNAGKPWSSSPKIYAHLYVDDAALGCPLVTKAGERPWVDWDIVGPEVLKQIKQWNDR